MNFFEQQARAKRNSGRLVLLLGLAVISLIAITTLAAMVLLPFVVDTSATLAQGRILAPLDLSQVAGITLVVIAVVLLGGLYKSRQLSQGGCAVAELLGGRLISLDPQDADERKILNVVEEMAIASGTPVPPVYVLEDEAINAFAAGLTPQDAVIGITRGCIQLLSRDELQGVVAHEFSHIFHGDMRLNTRLVSLLHGILLLGLIGELVLRGSSQARSVSRSKKGDGGAAILIFAVVLVVIGYAGTFFGNLIKAAVSRQREFLADASAVQFTRNPLGIGGALKKIGGHLPGSQVQASHAAEFSHMFFGQGVRSAFGSMMATHPPLDERIRRVEPGWDGAFILASPAGKASKAGLAAQAERVDRDLGQALGVVALAGSATPAAGDVLQMVDEAIAAIGAPDRRHLAHAQRTLGELDEQLRQAAHSPFAARALMFGLLLSRDSTLCAAQLAVLQGREADVYPLLIGLQDKLRDLQPRFRLPLIELALPALKQLSRPQAAQFKASLEALIRADQQVSLREWAFHRILQHNLDVPSLAAAQYELQQLPAETALLVSMLAYAGQEDEAQAYDAFLVARAQLPFAALLLVEAAALSIEALDQALTALAQLKPLHKPRLLKALARCIERDGRISVDEAELFRAVADTLDCPMPPLLMDVEHPATHYRPAPVVMA